MAAGANADTELAAHTAVASGLGGRYAAALYDLAREAGTVDEIRAELGALTGALKESPQFAQFVKSPLNDREAQGRAMAALLEAAGACDLTRRFIGVVIANRRLAELPEIIAAFHAIVAQAKGEVAAEIVSAHPLNDAQTARLKEKIRAIAGSDVQLDSRVDPALLGGFVVKIGSQMIDASLKTQLSRLQSILKEA